MPYSPGTWSFPADRGEADTCGGRDWGEGGEDMRGQACLQPEKESAALPQARGGVKPPPKESPWNVMGTQPAGLNWAFPPSLMSMYLCVSVINVQSTAFHPPLPRNLMNRNFF